MVSRVSTRDELRSSHNVPAPPLFRDDLDLDTTISEPNTSFSLDTTHQSNVVSSLKERIIAAKEHGTKVNTNNTESKDPIDKYTKYTKSAKENIYYSHPTAALDHIDVEQVGDWESLPDGKLLAHPFGHEVRSIESHQGIKANLFAAVVEITQSDTVGICSPHPCSPSLGTPTVFLIYNISELHRQMLLKREVWSSMAFTFRVTTLDPVSPDYLFAITNLTTKSKPEVKEVVRKVWDSENTSDFLETIIDTYPDDKQDTVSKNLADFAKSMWVDMLDTKKPGGAAAPTFNVYAKGNFINDDGLWCTLRNFLATQTYALQFQDPGMAGTDLHHCSICHSIEHPRGLCPFPNVTGWNGPFWDIPDPKHGGENWRRKLTSVKRGNGPNY